MLKIKAKMGDQKLTKTMLKIGPFVDSVSVELLLDVGANFGGMFQHKLDWLLIFVGSRCGPEFYEILAWFCVLKSVTLETWNYWNFIGFKGISVISRFYFQAPFWDGFRPPKGIILTPENQKKSIRDCSREGPETDPIFVYFYVDFIAKLTPKMTPQTNIKSSKK